MGFLKAVLWDLGDTIMQEETQEIEAEVTKRAELIPGVRQVIEALHARGIPLAIVADTHVGTCTNVLHQHGLDAIFAVRAISDELGVEKPHRRMFEAALDALGIPERERNRVVMVGNNLARDIKGASALGIVSTWFHWNDRYPDKPADAWERPDYEARDASELLRILEGLDDSSSERALVVAAAPRLMFDEREPFLPVRVGYTVLDQAGRSPSFNRLLDLYVSEGREAAKVIEYAVYWDWDIQHLYELEHIWVYVDADGVPIRVDGSWHGGYHVLGIAGPKDLPRPYKVYSQPGKHAFARTPDAFRPREAFTEPCRAQAGRSGLLITDLFHAVLEKDHDTDERVRRYLKAQSFTPTYSFTKEFVITDEIVTPWPSLRAEIPRRIDHCLQRLGD